MKKIIRIILLIVVLAFIFYMSSRNAFESNIYNVELVKLLKNNWGVDLYGLFGSGYVDVAVRKFGHFFEFLLLSITLYFALNAFKVRRATILTIMFCILLGAADEFHQLYIQGRSASLGDVIIDSMGAITAVSIISLVRIIKSEFFYNDDKYTARNE